VSGEQVSRDDGTTHLLTRSPEVSPLVRRAVCTAEPVEPQMISLFCCRLIFGAALCWLLMPRSLVTFGFFRIQHFVALGLAVTAALTLPSSEGALLPMSVTRGVDVAIAIVAYVGSVVWTLGRRNLGLVSIVTILLLSAVAIAGTMSVPAGERAPSVLHWYLGELTSAWLVGSVTTAMLLGHWYLTATAMPLKSLQRLNQFLLTAVVLRVLMAGAGLLTCPVPVTDGTHATWLAIRWLAGLAGPLMMALLVPRILMYRNTQSATGVLFAGVILAFMGEMAATLLSGEVGWPL
jgi:hypothetical protein